MARFLLFHQSARGGEIRNLVGEPRRGCTWHEVPTSWFKWKTVLSVPWKTEDSHINVCEARARDLSVRLRARQVSRHSEQFLHFMGSQVNLAVAAKGRSGSVAISHVQRRTSAALLASNMRDINAYTASKSNPADKGSRDFKAWARARRRLGVLRSAKRRELLSSSWRHPPVRDHCRHIHLQSGDNDFLRPNTSLEASAPPGVSAQTDRAEAVPG